MDWDLHLDRGMKKSLNESDHLFWRIAKLTGTHLPLCPQEWIYHLLPCFFMSLLLTVSRQFWKPVSFHCIFSFNCCAATAHPAFVLYVTVGISFCLHLFHCSWQTPPSVVHEHGAHTALAFFLPSVWEHAKFHFAEKVYCGSKFIWVLLLMDVLHRHKWTDTCIYNGNKQPGVLCWSCLWAALSPQFP